MGPNALDHGGKSINQNEQWLQWAVKQIYHWKKSGIYFAVKPAAEKNNEEQIRMCFEAYHSSNWKTLID